MAVTRKIQTFHRPSSFTKAEAEDAVRKVLAGSLVSRSAANGRFVEVKRLKKAGATAKSRSHKCK